MYMVITNTRIFSFSDNVQRCFFGNHLIRSETALTEFVKCDRSQWKKLSTLDKELQQMIVERGCVTQVDEDVDICQNHEDILGKYFIVNAHANRNCLWPSHCTKRKMNTLETAFNFRNGDERKQSLHLYSNYGIVLPFQSKVCHKCKKDCITKLKGFNEDSIRTPEIQRKTLEIEYVPDDSPTISSASQLSYHQEPLSQTSSQSSWTPPSPIKQKNQKRYLDSLIREYKKNVKVDDRLREDWNNVGPKRQQQILNYTAAGVAAVIQTIVPNNDQAGLVYRKLIESNYVEKHLDSEVPISSFDEEIVNTANGLADSYQALQQYFSTICELPGINFKYLNQFNAEPNDENLSDESEDEDTNCGCKANKKLKFIFKFTYHLWILAKKHRKRNGYGMAPIFKEKSFKWYYDIDLLTTIFDYVVSPLNTQRNSYGVFNIKQESGEKATIGRVIRHHNNSDMVRNIQAHLRSLGLTVPSQSFLFKFLSNLPAASTKEMRGVNNTQEDAMRAFTMLENIVDVYAIDCNLSEDQRINLKSCLASSKTYLKTQYFDHLSINSPVLSHCVSCSVSDENDNAKFKAPCQNKHQTITCEHCELIYDTIAVLKTLMEKYRDEEVLSVYDAAVVEKRLNDAQAAIHQYQSHLIKVYTQEKLWQDLMEKRDSEVAFYEADWGMKILPRRYRGKQSEWYGQNGMSNHIGCFTRIVPNSIEADEINPKSHRKQVDTYTCIIKDSAKQDALTTAAIIKENLIAYKRNYPEVKKVYLRSDCAGCYKCNKLIQAVYSIEIEDLDIMGYIYSAPCDGKSICDTYAAIVKVSCFSKVKLLLLILTTFEFSHQKPLTFTIILYSITLLKWLAVA